MNTAKTGLELYPHNEKAYRAVVDLISEEGKAAVIHPTGTGKSFVAFKLAEEHPECRILWLAPSEYIFQTQVENMKNVCDKGKQILAGITFRTYSKLMMNEDEINEFRPDYIILDEFHRCGAAEWGKSVQKLLEAYPSAGILGLSATNVRYLDQQRDMAEEIFDGCIASEMTLGEAIARDILPAPTYVISMYSYQEELKKLKARVNTLKNPVLQKENEKILEELRRTLELADGLDTIFDRHMTRNGKYIVFCRNKEHMEEMIEHVQEWFGMVDANPQVYAVYYDNAKAKKLFAEFKEDDSEHLKLLFCIDMLNEGIHVEKVDGVILLRPTVSPILYYQQIGRALSTGNGKQPVIFDIVNNFDSLYAIDSLQKETEEAVSFISHGKGELRKFQERFQIIDEMRNCKELFAQLNRNLTASWDLYYAAAVKYYNQKGHLRIPKSHVTDSGLNLGSWLMTQRRVRAGKVAGNLTPEQIRRLDAIGMEWENGSIRGWNRGYAELLAYKDAYGNLDIKASYVTADGFALGKWVSNLRSKWSHGEMEAERIQQLDALGMIWDKHTEQWNRNYRVAKAYYELHGNLRIPHNYRTKDGINLGLWIYNQRIIYAGKKKGAMPLREEQIQRLDLIGMVWKNG